MKTSLVALCAESEHLQYLGSWGLAEEDLSSQGWLRLYTSGEIMRAQLDQDQSIDEAWIVSCDDVAPINLAAALKADRQNLTVRLLPLQDFGSVNSRAKAAGVDALLTWTSLIDRYVQCKGEPSFTPGQESTTQKVATQEISTQADANQEAEAQNTLLSFNATELPPRKGSAFLLPIVSGSGGSGKSTLSVLAALSAHLRGYKTLLLDLDLQFGDMSELLGIQNPLRIDEFISNPSKRELLKPSVNKPALLAAPQNLEDAELVVDHLSSLLDQVSKNFEVIICNTGSSWAEHHAVLLERSSKALFLIDQRSSSLRACRRALDLCVRCGIAINPFVFVLNRCAKKSPLSSMDASFALQGLPVVEIKEGGNEVEGLLSAGSPRELFEIRNDAYVSLETLLLDIFPYRDVLEDVAEDGEPVSRWSFFRGKCFRKGR